MHSLYSKYRSPALRIVLALLVLGCLGLPVNTLWHFALLAVAMFALALLPLAAFTPRRLMAVLAAAAAAALLNHMLPRAAIEEGHNVFLPEGVRMSVAPGMLPDAVYARLKQEFDLAHPESQRCAPQAAGCWRAAWGGMKAPQSAYARSLDDVYRQAKYSRVVDDIDFAGLDELRAGFVNEAYYHWWGDAGVQRSAMPYYVMYELNDRVAGSSLCWRGEVLWEGERGQFAGIEHEDMACREIAAADSGRRVFGLGVDPARPLAMQLRLDSTLAVSGLIRQAAIVLAVAVILALALRWDGWRNLLLPGALVGLAVLFAVLRAPGMLHGYPPFIGGDDGLTYEGYGREILQRLLAGDVAGALRGEEDVYYFMPGMRYMRALGFLLFGETHFGYLLVLLAMPLAAYGVARLLLPRAWSLAVILLGSSFFFRCFDYANGGAADPMGYALFMAAMWLALDAASGLQRRWLGHFILALAVFVRPNLVIAALALMLVGAWQTARTRTLRSALLASSGFLVIALVPLHNYVFGGRFVPLTAAAAIPENLKAPPAAYVHALGEALSGSFSGAGMQTVMAHLLKFGASWVFLMVVLALGAWAHFRRARVPVADGFLAITAALFVPFLFYDASPRYALFAWFCAFVLAGCYVHLLRNSYLKPRPAVPLISG